MFYITKTQKLTKITLGLNIYNFTTLIIATVSLVTLGKIMNNTAQTIAITLGIIYTGSALTSIIAIALSIIVCIDKDESIKNKVINAIMSLGYFTIYTIIFYLLFERGISI